MRVASRRIAIALSAVVPVAAAATLAAVPNATRVNYTEHKLKNGLRVLIAEDHRAPVVSVAIVYNAGSRDERKGRTGFAHLFEHMMFKGSANVADGEHLRLVQNNGGRINATTDQDRTLYYDTLPANQLDLGALPRGRSHAVARRQPGEPRQPAQRRSGRAPARLDNQPYGRTFEAVQQDRLRQLVYKHSPIGSMEDLNAATRRRRRGVLQDVLRAEQRRHGDRRRRQAPRPARQVGSTSKAFRRSRRRPKSTCRSRRRPPSGVRRSRIRSRASRGSTSSTRSPTPSRRTSSCSRC